MRETYDVPGDARRRLRRLSLILALAAVAAVFGARAGSGRVASPVDAASAPARPACTATDARSPWLISRDGYIYACGPGSAVVHVNGKTYRVTHSKCIDRARLYFGATRQSSRLAPRNGVSLFVERDASGEVNVIDGALELITGRRATLWGSLSGSARSDRRLRRGSFVLRGRSGTVKGLGLTGSWNCG